jgi:rhodanese-related sulfurtransferase
MNFLTAQDISDEHILIDVRTPAEFRGEKIPNSVNMPLDQLPKSAGSLAHQENIVLVCASGNRAKKAQEILGEHNVTAVVLEKGLKGWKECQRETEVSTSGVISLERQVRIVAGSLAAAGGFLALFVHPYWAALSAFVGCGLVFAGVTDTCGMAMVLAKLPFNKK